MNIEFLRTNNAVNDGLTCKTCRFKKNITPEHLYCYKMEKHFLKNKDACLHHPNFDENSAKLKWDEIIKKETQINKNNQLELW